MCHHNVWVYRTCCKSLKVDPKGQPLHGWCPNHTKLFIRFEPWNCWGFCWEIDDGSPLFSLLQPEMPTDGVGTSAKSRQMCDRPLSQEPWPWISWELKRSKCPNFQTHVVRSRALKCSVKSSCVNRSSTKCSLNGFYLFMRGPHTWSNIINQRLWDVGVPWSPCSEVGLLPRGGLWK